MNLGSWFVLIAVVILVLVGLVQNFRVGFQNRRPACPSPVTQPALAAGSDHPHL